jgi:hypothetical protein
MMKCDKNSIKTIVNLLKNRKQMINKTCKNNGRIMKFKRTQLRVLVRWYSAKRYCGLRFILGNIFGSYMPLRI